MVPGGVSTGVLLGLMFMGDPALGPAGAGGANEGATGVAGVDGAAATVTAEPTSRATSTPTKPELRVRR